MIHAREMRNVYKHDQKRNHMFRDLGVDERIMLNWISVQRYDMDCIQIVEDRVQ